MTPGAHVTPETSATLVTLMAFRALGFSVAPVVLVAFRALGSSVALVAPGSSSVPPQCPPVGPRGPRCPARYSAAHHALTSSIEGAFSPSLFFLLYPQRSLKNLPGASLRSDSTVM